MNDRRPERLLARLRPRATVAPSIPDPWRIAVAPPGLDPYLAATLWLIERGHGALIAGPEAQAHRSVHARALLETVLALDGTHPGPMAERPGLGIVLAAPTCAQLERLQRRRFDSSASWFFVPSETDAEEREWQDAWLWAHSRPAPDAAALPPAGGGAASAFFAPSHRRRALGAFVARRARARPPRTAPGGADATDYRRTRMSSMTNLPPTEDRPPLASPRPLPIEVFDPGADPDRHAGRGAVRRTVLAMAPIAGEELLLPGPMGSVGAREGAFWGLQAKNGITVALRAASFVNALAARRDAVEILTRAADLEFVDVQAGTGGTCSAWVLLDRRVVMVSGQAWGPRAKSTVAMLRSTLTGLPRA